MISRGAINFDEVPPLSSNQSHTVQRLGRVVVNQLMVRVSRFEPSTSCSPKSQFNLQQAGGNHNANKRDYFKIHVSPNERGNSSK